MKQFKKKWQTVFLIMLMAFFVTFAGGTKQTSAAVIEDGNTVKCKVVFADRNGRVSTQKLKKMARTVNSGTTIQLPKYQETGYKCVWVTKSGGKVTRKYNPGQKVTISKSTRFYLLTYKTYTVRFYTANGKNQYKKYAQTVQKGTRITLPQITVSSQTAVVGWKTSLNSTTTLKAGTKIKVTSNRKLYAVTKTVKSYVNLYTNAGGSWKKIDNSNGTAVFPDVNIKNGDMCLGWSRTPGQNTKPQYYGGDTIPTKTGNYYMVVFHKSMDQIPASLMVPATYDRVYFVGDSRTKGLANSLGTDKSSKVDLVYKAGRGLDWFINEGYSELVRKLSQDSPVDTKAVVINLGINDLSNLSRYVVCMRKFATKLQDYGCDMYYMSVNPFNSAMFPANYTRRTPAKIINFNNTIRQQLCTGSSKCYTYIDTFSSLRKYGWISQSETSTEPDGLHYTRATYLRIYNYCIKFLNQY